MNLILLVVSAIVCGIAAGAWIGFIVGIAIKVARWVL